MAFFMMSVAIGNLFTRAVNFLIQSGDDRTALSGASCYAFFTGLMLITAGLFLVSIRLHLSR